MSGRQSARPSVRERDKDRNHLFIWSVPPVRRCDDSPAPSPHQLQGLSISGNSRARRP